MQITALKLSNFKGISGTWKFTPLTLIVGANFSGKSALIDGIRVGLRGYHPDLGKLNGDTFQLASDDHMQVDVEIDGAPGFCRQWARISKGDKTTIKEHTQYGCPLRFDDVPMLDPRSYFSLSDKDRTDYIFQRTKGSTTPDDILAKIQEIMDENEDVTTWDEAAFESIKDKVIDVFEETSVHAGVNQIVEWLKEEFTKWNRLVRERAGASAELNRITAAKPEFYADKDAMLDEETATNDKIAKLSEQIGAAHAILCSNQKIYLRREQITEFLKQPLADEPKAPKKPKACPSSKEVNVAKLRVSSAAGLLSPIQSKKEHKHSRRANLAHQLRNLEQVTQCPHCGSKSEGWKSNLEKSIREEQELLSDDSELDALIDKYQAEHKEAVAELERLESEFGKLTTYNLALRSYESDLSAHKSAVARRLELAQELEQLQPDQEQDVTALQESLKTLQVARDDTARMIRTIDRWDTEMALSSKAVEGLREAEAWLKTIKAAQAKIGAVKSELIDSVFTAITDPANRIGGDLLPTPIAFYDGCVGRFEGHRFIRYFTFSGTEQSITFASIAAALSMSFPFRLLLLDEMGVMTASTQSKLLATFSAAVERGDLHQVICVMPREKSITLANWSVITTTK